MNNIGSEYLPTKPSTPYLLRPSDILYIQIQTQDQKTSELVNRMGSGNMNQTQMQGYDFLFGYSISDSGYIQLPLLGMFKVVGLTINQTKELIQTETNKYLNDGIAVVKLLNFKVTVLGEVNGKGILTSRKENLTIFEGIAMAGDFTDFADRSNVLIARQTPEGLKTARLNLHNKNITSSEFYYLLPNDVIFVEPRKGKVLNMNVGNISFFISLLNTALLLYTFFVR